MNTVLARAARQAADPERVQRFLGALAGVAEAASLARFTPEQARCLAALASGSQAQAEEILNTPELLAVFADETRNSRREKASLESELEARFDRDGQELKTIRGFRRFHLLRIAIRDLARLGALPEIVQELSDLAEVCLEAAWRLCFQQLAERAGRPWHQGPSGRWQPTEGCVIALGKLGGRELNYSSDVDLLFAYNEEGDVFRGAPGQGKSPRPVMSNHQFFQRLAEAFISEVTRRAPEGFLYRIDMRLRPEGNGGPLSRSLASYENYYAQWGQTWERMMLIKARGVAGDRALVGEFLEMAQPFRFPRSINPNVLAEVAAMKDRIDREVVKTGELDRNVKLGRGGIREIEFIVQSQQLLHAGRQPFLQAPQTLDCLQKLVQYELLPAEDAVMLGEAYQWLREVEHRLQMEDGRQTHTIPEAPEARQRLARLMDCGTAEEFEAAREARMKGVRRIFERRLKADTPGTGKDPGFPPVFEGFEDEWRRLLTEHRFRDVEKGLQLFREFVEGPGFVHVSARTSNLARQLIPRLLALCPGPGRVAPRVPSRGADAAWREAGVRAPLSDPDRVLTRLESFIGGYGARGTLFELWNRNPDIFELLALLFDRSEFLAELAIRDPDLVDELVISGRLRQRKASGETLRDLRHGIGDADQHLWLRQYHQAELMRIGLRDILGLADFEQYLEEFSALADACLRYAVEVVVRRHRLKASPFAIIGLGKLGGAEIDYGSDLDLLFVAPNSARNFDRLSKLAIEVMDLLSGRTAQGLLFQTDARLRPDGEDGRLVNSLKAFEEYYHQRAQLWEIQSLTRARAVAGDPNVGAEFEVLAGELADFSRRGGLAEKFGVGWPAAIHAMRMRIQRERTPAGREDLAIKTGAGGLMDAEFVAQVMSMKHGWREPNTLRALQRAEQTALPGGAELIDNYRRLRRIEGILRRWSYEGESVLPADPAPFYRVSVRCGFAAPEAFRAALADWRASIREVYNRVLIPAER